MVQDDRNQSDSAIAILSWYVVQDNYRHTGTWGSANRAKARVSVSLHVMVRASVRGLALEGIPELSRRKGLEGND